MAADEEDPVQIPYEMFDDEEQAVLAPVFTAGSMEAEIVRSMLEANGIPAVVFGTGYYELENSPAVGHRVMVRERDIPAALQVLSSAELAEGEIVEPDEDDLEVLVDADYADDDEEYEIGYGAEDVEVLAGGSDWGTRVVGVIGILALAIAVAVLIAQAE